MSNHFCASCNRLRITADGNLKVCLHDGFEVSLRDQLRERSTESTGTMRRTSSACSGGGIDAYGAGEAGVVADGSGRDSNSDNDDVKDDDERLKHVIEQCVKQKKESHPGMMELQSMENRPMIKIGG